jgi:hypothetical protein
MFKLEAPPDDEDYHTAVAMAEEVMLRYRNARMKWIVENKVVDDIPPLLRHRAEARALVEAIVRKLTGELITAPREGK